MSKNIASINISNLEYINNIIINNSFKSNLLWDLTSQIETARTEERLIEPKKEKIKEKEKVEEIKLTEAQKQTNNKIMKSAIYGSFYKRNDEKDSIFRIIDNRNLSKNEIEDGRKILSGMACSSFNKKDLLEIAVFLKLNFDPKEQKIDKTFLCKSIHDELKRKNKILI